MHIYCITNLVNGKVYIGQHSGENIERYLRRNISNAASGSNSKPHLYNAIRSYGGRNFVIHTIARPIDKQQMDELEKFFIRTCESQNPDIGYNITSGGGGALGYQHPEEHKAYLAEIYKGRPFTPLARSNQLVAVTGKPAHNKGKKMSEAQRLKLSLAMKGRKAWNKGKTWGESTRQKLSDNAKRLHLLRERNTDGTFAGRLEPEQSPPSY